MTTLGQLLAETNRNRGLLDPEGRRRFGLHTQGVCSECGWDSHGTYRGESNRACWQLRAETHLNKFPNCSLAQKGVAHSIKK